MSELFLIYLTFIFGAMFLYMNFNCTIKKSISDKLIFVFVVHMVVFVVWLYWFGFVEIKILELF